ncbi:helix-turn-helix domain-containing protein [Saccharomonospora iraqiensis]|uniref:helix-turn-helix domain-containing protein n=1 Tax=Saccharomonospora iraqiensis TaxID=52698 RepID=UPI00047B73B2|nr:helix-turn-helix transcriptional regulator [Saccharomonospora iraqiensis]
MASNADTPRARALGAELRQARETAGLSQEAVARQVGRTKSHVSRWENGRLTPAEAEVAQVIQLLGVPCAERERLLDLARAALDPNWIAPGVDKQLAALTDYERTAKLIVNVQPMLIPGLMQTYDYARHLMLAGGISAGEAEQNARLRVGRQHVVPKTRLLALIGEHALRYPPCSADVMVEQLDHLRALATRDNIEVRVLSYESPLPMRFGSWVLMEFTRARPVVHLEHYDASATITDPKSVARYQGAVATLREAAMSPADSSALIADVLDTMKGTS